MGVNFMGVKIMGVKRELYLAVLSLRKFSPIICSDVRMHVRNGVANFHTSLKASL